MVNSRGLPTLLPCPRVTITLFYSNLDSIYSQILVEGVLWPLVCIKFQYIYSPNTGDILNLMQSPLWSLTVPQVFEIHYVVSVFKKFLKND